MFTPITPPVDSRNTLEVYLGNNIVELPFRLEVTGVNGARRVEIWEYLKEFILGKKKVT